jgi:hypothetical protein
MRRGTLAVVAVVTALAWATSSSPAAGQKSQLVGRWQTTRSCQALVTALRQYGLGPVAPTVVGDFFPGKTPAQLAKKPNICSGATKDRHSHFFAADGMFGSLDQNGQRVDDGTWKIVGTDTFRIGGAAFRFRISGSALSLTPLITAAQKRTALAHPLRWSTAGWMVAVTFPGLTWARVPCAGWC